MKWIRTNHKLPKDGQCVFVVFEYEPGSIATWYAQYKNGKRIGSDIDCGIYPLLSGDAICWMPVPESPFCDEDD